MDWDEPWPYEPGIREPWPDLYLATGPNDPIRLELIRLRDEARRKKLAKWAKDAEEAMRRRAEEDARAAEQERPA
jgi:hypothetical protein